MKEPYKQVVTVDETRTSVPAPVSGDLILAAAISSPTGPLTRTKLTGTSDLISRFMTGSAFSLSDDVSLKYVAKILKKSPVYVLRVDPSQMRAGIGSHGHAMYFDKNYNLISIYRKVIIDTAPAVVLGTIYIGLAGILYYCGDIADVPASLISKYSTRVAIAKLGGTTISIDYFLEVINETRLAAGSSAPIIFLGEGRIKVLGIIADASANLTGYAANDLTGTMSKYAVSLSSGDLVKTGEYIQIGNYSIYNIGDGLADTSSLVNPIGISSKWAGDMPAAAFFSAALDAVMTSDYVVDFDAASVKASVTIAFAALKDAVTLTLSTELAKYVYAVKSSAKYIISTANITNLLSSGYLKLTLLDASTILFYFGASTDQTANIVHHISTAAISPLMFVNLIHQYSLVTTPGYTSNGLTFSAFDFYYNAETTPAISSNFVDTDVLTVTAAATETIYEALVPTDDSLAGIYEYPGLWMKFNDVLYYTGTIIVSAGTVVNMKSGNCSMPEFYDLLLRNLPTSFTIGMLATGFLISGDITITAHASIDITTDQLTNQTGLDDKFAFIAKFPCTQNLFQFKYTINSDNENIYDITLTYNGVSKEYQISFLDSEVDGFGTNLTYQRLNAGDGENAYFYIKLLTGTNEYAAYTSNLFGSAIRMPESDAVDFSATILKFLDYEDMYIDLLLDSGVTQISYAKDVVATAITLKSLAPISIPTIYTDKSDIKIYKEAIGADTAYAIYVAPGFADASLGNFLTDFPGSITYVESVIDKKNAFVPEFAPIFGANRGLVSASNLKTNLSKTDREYLLDYQVNTIFNGIGGPRINFNLTAQKSNSYLSEDQNIRLANVIAHLADDYVDSLIAEYNTAPLRASVVENLNKFITERVIVGKEPTIQKFMVICDDTNNPTPVVEARQIIIDVYAMYYRSIAYALVYNRVKKIGSF